MQNRCHVEGPRPPRHGHATAWDPAGQPAWGAVKIRPIGSADPPHPAPQSAHNPGTSAGQSSSRIMRKKPAQPSMGGARPPAPPPLDGGVRGVASTGVARWDDKKGALWERLPRASWEVRRPPHPPRSHGPRVLVPARVAQDGGSTALATPARAGHISTTRAPRTRAPPSHSPPSPLGSFLYTHSVFLL